MVSVEKQAVLTEMKNYNQGKYCTTLGKLHCGC